MKFHMVDRITALAPGERINTVKSLAYAEEYLADHFPTFPVMPGVLMLECLVQSAGWLVRVSEDFAHSLINLALVKNVTFKSFLAPGQLLQVEVECRQLESRRSEFSGWGRCGANEIVKARFELRHENLAERDPGFAALDHENISHARRHYALLSCPAAAERKT
ncbi:MAG: hypothetical protein HJJLKODD_00913 [Phycisphaerae bacterium]|nr:hypothetical protein [Phycisphaerae bacterium]